MCKKNGMSYAGRGLVVTNVGTSKATGVWPGRSISENAGWQMAPGAFADASTRIRCWDKFKVYRLAWSHRLPACIGCLNHEVGRKRAGEKEFSERPCDCALEIDSNRVLEFVIVKKKDWGDAHILPFYPGIDHMAAP